MRVLEVSAQVACGYYKSCLRKHLQKNGLDERLATLNAYVRNRYIFPFARPFYNQKVDILNNDVINKNYETSLFIIIRSLMTRRIIC